MKTIISNPSRDDNGRDDKGDVAEQVSGLKSMQPYSGSSIFTATGLSTMLGALIGYGIDKILFKSSHGPLSAALDTAFIAGIVSFFSMKHENKKIKDIQDELDAKFGRTVER